MLRNIALGLLLANILLLAWKSWVILPDVENPGRMSSGDEPQLVLLKDPASMANTGSTDAVASAAEGQDTGPPAQARRRCVRVGPFAEVDVAESVGDQLGDADFGVRRSSKVGEIWVGYWVQLVDLKTAEKAADTVDRLINAGLVDAYIFQAEPTINISLGVFRSRKGADRVAGMARQLNLKPQMTDRFHPGVEHWLTVEIPGSREFSLSEVSLPSNRILRTEGVQCGADTMVDARIQP
jgi:hypothetical protein